VAGPWPYSADWEMRHFSRLTTTFLLLSRIHLVLGAAGLGINAGPAGEALLPAGDYFVARSSPTDLRARTGTGRWAVIRGELPAIYTDAIRI